MNRQTVLAGALAAALAPRVAGASEPNRYKCHARLVREPDHKETRTADAVCEEGKAVTAIDGDKDYKTSPPTVIGLRVTFTAKADVGAKIALHAATEFRTTKVTIVGGLTQISASVEVVASLSPGELYTSPMDVNGTTYTLELSVTPTA